MIYFIFHCKTQKAFSTQMNGGERNWICVVFAQSISMQNLLTNIVLISKDTQVHEFQ